jgi:thiol-disulfide isomerase/thioredoxin
MRWTLGGVLVLISCSRSSTDPQRASDPPSPVLTVSALPLPASVTPMPAASDAPREARESGVRVVVASADSDGVSLVRTERLKAKAEGRVLVVYAGATWCEPCKRFKEEVHSGRLDGKLPHITLLTFDADRDVDRLSAAGYRFSFIPFVALPGPDGHPSDVQEARGKGGNAWHELVAKLEAWDKKGP